LSTIATATMRCPAKLWLRLRLPAIHIHDQQRHDEANVSGSQVAAMPHTYMLRALCQNAWRTQHTTDGKLCLSAGTSAAHRTCSASHIITVRTCRQVGTAPLYPRMLLQHGVQQTRWHPQPCLCPACMRFANNTVQ
jgi:hypothetical protein